MTCVAATGRRICGTSSCMDCEAREVRMPSSVLMQQKHTGTAACSNPQVLGGVAVVPEWRPLGRILASAERRRSSD